MRWTLVIVGAAAGCDPTFQQVGPGDPNPNGSTDTGASAPWHCDRASIDGRCFDYVGPGWDASSRYADCGVSSAAGGCPASDIGGCNVAVANPLERIDWYYSGDFYSTADAPYLQSVCESSLSAWVSP